MLPVNVPEARNLNNPTLHSLRSLSVGFVVLAHLCVSETRDNIY